MEAQCRIQKGSPIIPKLSLTIQIPPNGIYIFKIYFNIVLPCTPRFPRDLFSMGLSVRILIALLFSSIFAAQDFIRIEKCANI